MQRHSQHVQSGEHSMHLATALTCADRARSSWRARVHAAAAIAAGIAILLPRLRLNSTAAARYTHEVQMTVYCLGSALKNSSTSCIASSSA